MYKRIIFLTSVSLLLLLSLSIFSLAGIRESVYQTELEKVQQNLARPQDISNYLLNNIEYKSDHYLYEENRLAEETVALGYGDCEDMAILALTLLQRIGIDAELYMIVNNYEAHCICIWQQEGRTYVMNNGVLLDIQSEDIYQAAAAVYDDYIYFNKYQA